MTRLTLGCVAVLLVPATAVSQATEPVPVTGVVADVSTGQPIPGAQVRIRGTGVRVVTDEAGRFMIRDVPAGEQVWVIESLGYATWEQPLVVTHADRLTIGLLPRPVALEEIRASVDRLETRRRMATVSVHSVDGERLRGAVSIHAAGAVRSFAPWVTVSCPRTRNTPMEDDRLCIRHRGGTPAVPVCLDERPSSMVELLSYDASELHAVDFVGGAEPQVRAYTVYFLEKGKRLRPLSLGCRGP